MSELLNEAKEFGLYLSGRSGRFKTRLYDAFQAADEFNLVRLQKGFPIEHEVFIAWRTGTLKDLCEKKGER